MCQTKEKHEDKQVDMCVLTPVDVLKGNYGCYAEKEQINCKVY